MNINIHPVFLPLLQPVRYKGAYGGRGSGKSHFFAEMVVLAALQGKRIVCLREVQNSIKDSVKQLISDKIIHHGLQRCFTVLDQEIRASSGGLIIFKGLQSYNATNIKSLENFDIAWVEEAQAVTQHSFDMLRPTIRAVGSELWFSWNPLHKTDAVDKFFRSSNQPNAVSVMVNWTDNPWFKDTPLYADMVVDYQVDPDKADHVWGGAYGSSQGAILAKWVNKAERDGRINDGVSYDKDGAGIVVSCDLGYRDTCSWWYWQPVYGGFKLLRYDYGHGMDVNDWTVRIKGILNGIDEGVRLDRIWLPHDAKVKTFQSKHSSLEAFWKEFGVGKIDIVPVSSKLDQIQAARHVIGYCEFNSVHCADGLDGLRGWEYEYNEDDEVFSRAPKHDRHSHPSDAYAYGCQVMMEHVKESKKQEEPKYWHQQTLDELWRDSPKKVRRL